MKRIFSLLLSCVLVLSLFGLCAEPAAAANSDETAAELVAQEPTVADETVPEETEADVTEPEETTPEVTEPEETGMKTSDELIALLKFEEGFCKYPVWDYSQYTVGYGTRCPSDMVAYYKAHGITDAEAEALLRDTLANTEYLLNVKIIEKYGLKMTQGQFDALVSFSYNMGPGWITSPSQNIHQQVAAGATGNTIIDALSRWCKAGGEVKSFLVRRRLSESYMYLESKYAHTPPDNYCYVKYSGNGGSTGQSVQGYNADYKGAPTAVATHGSYTFSGWYTERSGGVKVEVLTKELNGTTLYAHWNEVEYEEPELFDEPITVTVTAEEVNLRKGPGTNYARVGSAEAGDKFDIWQIEVGGSYTWGYYKGGWIALEYTDYEKVTGGEATEPEETDPEQSQPSEPEETDPEPTEPEETDPPAKVVQGVVNADPYLCVRSGPGTGYPTVDTLRTGEKVEILEQKVNGSMIWGRVSNGWISMAYVTVSEDFESEVDPGTPAGKTGTVTCSKLNVRYGAGVGYSIVGEYRQGDIVTITEQKTVGTTTWGKTAKGWVSMDYISLKESDKPVETPEPEDPEEEPVEGLTGTVNSDDVLRIRGGAGTNYSIVGYYNPNTKVTILEQKTVGATTWGRTAKGWISMDYVTLDGEEQEPEEQPSTGKTGTITCSKLYIRGGAGTSYSTVGSYYQGDQVVITEQKLVGSTTWGKTAKGWISMDYVKLDSDDSSEPSEPEDEDIPATMVRTVNVSCLLVRSGAGTGYSQVGYLYRGAKVTVTETKTVNGALWGKISGGWICLDYTV